LKRIADIKSRIKKDLDKNCLNKKYQIKSRIEYDNIRKWCEIIDMKGHKLLWHHDRNLMINKLDKIIEGNYFCCKECDSPMIFVNQKVPVMYCYLSKN
jgi:hypothetical protein